MHLVFYARGILQQVELFKIFMQTQYFKWGRINLKTKKKEYCLVQGALRPSVLGTWEYIFPREALPSVLSMMKIEQQTEGATGKRLEKLELAFLRKILGVKKIPSKAYKKAAKIPPSLVIENHERALGDCKVNGVSVHIIGIKEDIDSNFKAAGYRQEML
jgi:hypothetical protein